MAELPCGSFRANLAPRLAAVVVLVIALTGAPHFKTFYDYFVGRQLYTKGQYNEAVSPLQASTKSKLVPPMAHLYVAASLQRTSCVVGHAKLVEDQLALALSRDASLAHTQLFLTIRQDLARMPR